MSLAAVALFDVGLSLHHDFAAPSSICGFDGIAAKHIVFFALGVVVAKNNSASREIRTFDEAHEIVDGHIFKLLPAVDHVEDGVYQLAQVMWGNVSRHAHGDAGGSVEQQVGQRGWQHGWLLFATVVIFVPIDRIFLQIGQNFFAIAREAGLGVTHGGWRIAIDRAEVALAIDHEIAHRKVLRHTGHRVINAGIAVGVVTAHHIADHAGRLAVRRGGACTGIVHGV